MIRILETDENTLADALAVERLAFGADVEARLVSELLNDPSAEPCLSLLALDQGAAVGHILFSHARLSPPSPLSVSLLAPLAVVPDRQRQGIGRRLIATGLQQLQAAGIDLVFVLGHIDYYPGSGFEPAYRHGLLPPYPIDEAVQDAWMVQALRPGLLGSIRGTVTCADCLMRVEYWRE